jgi:hypothetical protein
VVMNFFRYFANESEWMNDDDEACWSLGNFITWVQTIMNSHFHICWADKSSDFQTWILLTHTWRRKISTMRVAWSSRWIFPYTNKEENLIPWELCDLETGS